jgi:hypothetical protein
MTLAAACRHVRRRPGSPLAPHPAPCNTQDRRVSNEIEEVDEPDDSDRLLHTGAAWPASTVPAPPPLTASATVRRCSPATSCPAVANPARSLPSFALWPVFPASDVRGLRPIRRRGVLATIRLTNPLGSACGPAPHWPTCLGRRWPRSGHIHPPVTADASRHAPRYRRKNWRSCRPLSR